MTDSLLLFLQSSVLFNRKVGWITGRWSPNCLRNVLISLLAGGTCRTTSGSLRKQVVWLFLPTKVTLFDSTNLVILCGLRLDLGFFYYVSHNEQQCCVPFFYWLYVPHERAIKLFYFEFEINGLLRIIKMQLIQFFRGMTLNTKVKLLPISTLVSSF